MSTILQNFPSLNGEYVQLALLSLAVLRVYLELIGVNLAQLPVSQFLAGHNGQDRLVRFHRMGLVFSIGYILFFAPGFLLA